MCCLLESADSASECDYCGQASWSAPKPIALVADDEKLDMELAPWAYSGKGKRGKK